MNTLEVNALGTFEARIGDQPVHWAATAARDLFQYLLSYPEGRSRDAILEELWDTEASAAAGNRFRVTVHRVREALGDPTAVEEDHGRYRLSANVLRASDVHAFHVAVDAAERAATPADRMRLYRRALELYTGDYLPDQRTDWADRTREEHKSAYVQAALELSLLACDASDCGGTVDALSSALRADPYVGENYHQKLMTCLSVVEGKYSAIEHYRRFLRFLRDEIEDQPMGETVSVAEHIKSDEPTCPRGFGPRRIPAGVDAPHTRACPLAPACASVTARELAAH